MSSVTLVHQNFGISKPCDPIVHVSVHMFDGPFSKYLTDPFLSI